MPGQGFAFLSSIVVLVLVIALVRNRRLSEQLSLFWLSFAALMMAGTSFGFPHYLKLAAWIGVVYPPSALFLLALLFLLIYTLYLSIAFSGLNEQNKVLAQELAMLRLEIEESRR